MIRRNSRRTESQCEICAPAGGERNAERETTVSATNISINQLCEREMAALREYIALTRRSLIWADAYRAKLDRELREAELELRQLVELREDAA